jgi:hypothetical protein
MCAASQDFRAMRGVTLALAVRYECALAGRALEEESDYSGLWVATCVAHALTFPDTYTNILEFVPEILPEILARAPPQDRPALTIQFTQMMPILAWTESIGTVGTTTGDVAEAKDASNDTRLRTDPPVEMMRAQTTSVQVCGDRFALAQVKYALYSNKVVPFCRTRYFDLLQDALL